MRRFDGVFFAVAVSIVPFLGSTLASAQQAQNQAAQGMPKDQVAALCPAGSHWQDAGFSSASGGKYKEGHCQKNFPSAPH